MKFFVENWVNEWVYSIVCNFKLWENNIDFIWNNVLVYFWCEML